MKVCNLSQGTQDFMTQNPFIFVNQGKLKGLILANQDHPLTLGEVQSLFKTYYISGMDCLLIVSPPGVTREAERFASSHPIKRIRLVSMQPDTVVKRFPFIPRSGNHVDSGEEKMMDKGK